MAIYLLSVKALSRSTGRSAIAAAAYRAGERLRDAVDFFTKKTKVHDYTKKGGVVSSGIVLPANAPAELNNRSQLWNTVERHEKRKDSRVAREVLISLPHELSAEEREAATLKLVNHLVDTYGVGADYAIHEPDRHEKADQRNHHAHILITTRSINADGLSPKVIAAFNDKKQGSETIEAIREVWEDIVNNALEAAQKPERVSRHTLQAQGIDRLPEPKQGAVATMMEKQGKTSHAGEERRKIKEFNEALQQIPDEDTEEDIDEPDDDTAPPVRRKREVSKTQAAIKEARKHDRNIARLVHRRMLELLRRLQQQRRRRQEQLRRRMQLLTRSMLMNTWRKNAGGNSANHNSQQQAQAPPDVGYSEAEILAALADRGFEMD